MNRPDIERLVKRWTQAVTEGPMSLFDELLADDAVDRSGPAPVQGLESFKARCGAVRAAFADLQVVVDDLIVETDAIAWRWTLTGTHVGAFAGLAPTGRPAILRGVNFQRIRGGKIAEHWTLVDVFGALQGLRS